MADCVVCGGRLSGQQRKYDTDECAQRARREQWLKQVYGLSLADYETILAHQGGRCAICQRPPRAGEVLHVDHEHAGSPEGPVRGILCAYCNTRLVGRLRDAERARRLADYLTHPPAAAALGRVVIAPGRPRKARRRKRKR